MRLTHEYQLNYEYASAFIDALIFNNSLDCPWTNWKRFGQANIEVTMAVESASINTLSKHIQNFNSPIDSISTHLSEYNRKLDSIKRRLTHRVDSLTQLNLSSTSYTHILDSIERAEHYCQQNA